MIGGAMLRWFPWLKIRGVSKGANSAGTTFPITVLMLDSSQNILYATGRDVPTPKNGYAKGCLFVNFTVGAGTSGLYVNVGTHLVCDFRLVSNA